MANKSFTLNFDASMNISQVKSAISEMQRAFSGLKLSQGLNTNIQNIFDKINDELKEFESLTNKSFHSLSDVSKASSSFERIIDYYKQLEKYSKEITGMDKEKFFSDSVVSNITKANKALQIYYKELETIPAEIEKANKALAKQEATLDSLTQKRNALAAENKSLGSTKGGISKKITAKEAEQSNLIAQMSSLEASGIKKSSAEYKALASQYNILTQELKKLKSEATELDSTMAKNRATIANLDSQINTTKINISQLKQELSQMAQSLNSASLDKLRTSLAEITKQDISQIPSDIKEIQTVINSLSDEELKRIYVAFENIRESAANAEVPISKTKNSLDGLEDSANTMARTADEIKRLQNQVLDFFSISNSIQLFKRTISSAFQTVKELDATMTEAAVVTDFSVGDMWNQLPAYSEEATKLGSSINNLYSATTLYYQQGLKTNEAMELGIETMKMARIANMEATKATDLMTAALRGFNMELNKTSATRINDVYSELAAVTAADTEEIGVAMSKTASIAASANMEFETTAALLAQIIETTREAPETAGTAMKTIIARFTEVKKLFSEGQLYGTDSEGQEISINKIDTALQTIGISLKDFLTGARGLDDILLELASKWDSLDIATQRYIATTAAGSRQQSRFLAIMSNYERTMELVEAANNSAGASQEQYEKTMDSLSAKLNNLANAWNEFTMGIANNQVIKTFIDLLTQLINTVNDLTSSLGEGVGGFLKLGLAIGGLKLGKSLIGSAFGFLGKSFSGLGKESGKNFSDTFLKSIRGIKSGITKEGREYANLMATVYSKELKSKKLSSSLLKSLFDDSEGSMDLAKNMKTLVSGIKDGAMQAIDYTSLNEEGKKLANGFLDSAASEITNSGKVKQAVGTLEEQLGSIDWSQYGAKNIQLKDNGSFDIQSKAVKKFTSNLVLLGGVAASVGLALGGLADALKEGGYDDAAAGVRALGTSFTTFGSIVGVVGGIIQAAGWGAQAAWGPIIGIVAGISAGIGVFTGISSAQAEMKENIRKANEAIIEQSLAVKEQREEEENLFKEYQNLYIVYQQTGEGKENLIEATKNLAEAYGIELNSLDLLADSYDKINQKMLEARKNSLEADLKTAKSGLITSEKNFLEQSTYQDNRTEASDAEEGRGQYFHGASGYATEDNIKIATIFRESFLANKDVSKYLYFDTSGSEDYQNGRFTFTGVKDTETLAKIYEELQNTISDIDSNIELQDIKNNSNVYNNVKQWLEDNQENYQNYIQLKKDLDTYSSELAEVYTSLTASSGNLPKIEDIKDIEDFKEYREEFITQLENTFKSQGIEKTEDEIQSLTDEYLSQIDSLSNFVQQQDIFDKITTDWEIKFEKGQSEEDLQKLIRDLQEKDQISILANLNLPKGLTFEQLQEYVSIIKNQIDSAFSKETIEVSGLAISSLLENGNLSGLDEEQTQKFNEKMQLTSGVYNEDITAQQEYDTLSQTAGIFEQIQYLTDLQQREADLAQQVTEESKKQLELQIAEKEAAIQTAQEKVQTYESTFPQNELGNITEYQDLQKQIAVDSELLKKLKEQLNSTDWDLKITTSGTENILAIGDALISQAEQIKNAAMLIGEGFKVATEDAQQLANIFPELMENAEVLSDGTIKLSAETVNAVLGNGQDIVNGDIDQTVQRIDNQIAVLESKKASAEAELELAKAVAQGDIDIDEERISIISDAQRALTEYLMQLGLDESEANAAVTAAMSGNMNEYNKITAGVADDTANNLANAMSSAATATWENADAMISSLDSIGKQAENVAVAIAAMAGGKAAYQGREATRGGSRGGTNFSATLREGTFSAAEIDEISAEKPNLGKWISDIQLDISGYTEGIAQLTALKSQLLASKSNSNKATDAASFGAGGASPFEDKKGSNNKGGGSSKKEAEKWENTYDWLYNLTQDINEQLRIREKLEKKYDRLLKDTSKSASDLHKNLKEQLSTLEKQRDMYQEMYDNRKEELKGVLEAGKGYSEYATYNWEDNTVEIDWTKLNEVTDKTQGQAIENYISQLEEIESKMDDAEDALDDITDEIEKLQNVGKDEYGDLESRVLDAIISREQEKIDKLSLIDESINDANTKLMNSIQSNLDKIRQDRQNQETEQSIEDNERRLAYLQQDTSGANALEIQQLQEELANQKQDYTDTLIDQKLSAIQEQNDKDSEERQYQIELAQAQLEEAKKNGEFWNEAYRLIKEGTDATGKLVQNSELITLLKGGEAWESMSDIQKMDWLSELETTVKAAMVYFSSQRQLEKIGKKSGKITFTNANGEKLTGTVQKDGSVKVSTSKGTYTYKDVFQNYDGTYRTLEINPDFKANASSKPSGGSSSTSNKGGSGNIKVGGLINAGKAQIYDYAGDESGERQYFSNDPIYKVLDEKNGYLLTRWHKLNTGYTGWFKKSDVKAYAKGGLADFTGPAWLDGTKSKPELVLNARDTENFIQLKDILSNLLRGDTSSGNSGDNYFEIHIDVDSLNNDYDVEQLATKIKKMINDDARYRNVNSINLLR